MFEIHVRKKILSKLYHIFYTLESNVRKYIYKTIHKIFPGISNYRAKDITITVSVEICCFLSETKNQIRAKIERMQDLSVTSRTAKLNHKTEFI